MGTVKSIALTNFRNEEALGFCQEIASRLADVKAIAESDAGKAFSEQILSYSGELDVLREVSYQKVNDADDAVDATIIGLRAHLQALLAYPRDDIREAARTIWNGIEPYGSPVRLPYNEEYAIVCRMLDTLEAMDAGLLSCTLMDAWVEALRKRYDAFMALRKEFHNERAEQPLGRVKATRQTLADSWKNLITYINGLAIIQPSAELNALVDVLNAIIQAKKTSLKLRKSAKKSAAEAATETIDIEP
ncbi:MAG: hypothetical protein II180_03480 [Proteobacteria bacterium]|nr:hypothetical protein [Pseudomonadota bacterium]